MLTTALRVTALLVLSAPPAGVTAVPASSALSSAKEPLLIRVLEREKATHAVLGAKALSCDATSLSAASVELDVAPRAVRLTVAGAAAATDAGTPNPGSCQVVTALGPTRVTVGAVTRTYLGTVKVVLEGGVLKFFNEIDVERYLTSVISAEANGSPRAALEAQAVVSRTFALTSRNRHAAAGYDLCDLTHCQLYRGQEARSAEAQAAVEKTDGQVLLVGGVALKPAFFHSACGGHTSRAADVFHAEGAGPGVSDLADGGKSWCSEAPDFSWEWTVDRHELATALGLPTEGAAFEPLRRDAAGRVIELKSFGRRFSGDEYFAKVGRVFGYQSLRSLKVTAVEAESTLHFTGVGLGHGVGLCQQGARAMAAKGADAKAILGHYFPDCQVRKPD